jgi:hypothetical protein
MNRKEFNKMVKQTKKLTHHQKVVLASQVFGTGVETDNYGQILIYTGLKNNDRGKLRYLIEEDFTCNTD